MNGRKMSLGILLVLMLVSLGGASANAAFEAKNPGGTGKGSAGETTFKDESAIINCEKRTVSYYQERTSGKWEEINKGPGEQPTKQGPHEEVVVGPSSNCTAFGFVGAEVKPCSFQLEQLTKGGSVTNTYVTECVIVAKGNCELKIAATKANERLAEVVVGNEGANSFAKLNVTGITTTATSLGGLGCVGIKNLKNNAGSETGTFTFEGQKIV
jgi:hypothetical protein